MKLVDIRSWYGLREEAKKDKESVHLSQIAQKSRNFYFSNLYALKELRYVYFSDVQFFLPSRILPVAPAPVLPTLLITSQNIPQMVCTK